MIIKCEFEVCEKLCDSVNAGQGGNRYVEHSNL